MIWNIWNDSKVSHPCGAGISPAAKFPLTKPQPTVWTLSQQSGMLRAWKSSIPRALPAWIPPSCSHTLGLLSPSWVDLRELFYSISNLFLISLILLFHWILIRKRFEIRSFGSHRVIGRSAGCCCLDKLHGSKERNVPSCSFRNQHLLDSQTWISILNPTYWTQEQPNLT